MKHIVLLILISLMFIGCESTDDVTVDTVVSPEIAPAASEKHPSPVLPPVWTVRNLRIKSFNPEPTATHIEAWVSYEINGTRTVSRLVKIPIGDNRR